MTDLEAVGGRQPPSIPAGDDHVMSLVDHLAELRRRLVISALAVLACSALGFYLAPTIVRLLVQPLPTKQVFFTQLGGAFFLQLRIGLIIGFALALPVLLYQFWAFVSPGLTARERRVARPWLPLAMGFFLVGLVVAYFVLPFAVSFLLSFALPEVSALITAENYFGFLQTLFLGFGLVMEFPIVLVLLAKLGIVSAARLRRSRRVVFLGIVVFAVVATPGGDPISPLVMAAVMYTLYEFTILMLGRSRAPGDDD